MSSYHSNPSVPPARIPTLKHRPVSDPVPLTRPKPEPVVEVQTEPAYADFLGGPADTRTTYAVEINRVS